MSITNYSELKTAIENWVDRNDLTDRIPEFIVLAEARLRRELRVLEMESATSTTLTAASVSLPSDWIGYRNVWINYAGTRHHLKYKSPHEMSRFNDGGTGLPNYFTVEADTIRVEPPPDSTYEMGFLYYQDIPALTDLNTTNWLLTDWPDLYLAGSLMEAHLFVHDNENASYWNSLFLSKIRDLKSKDKRDRWSGAPMAVSAN